jgi:hypothetical protein
MGEQPPIDSDAEKSAALPNEQEQRFSSGHAKTSKNSDVPTTQDASTGDESVEYPSGAKVALIMVSNVLAVFLVALVRRETSPDPLSNFLKDRSIVATAIPHISNDFRSLNGIGWYGSAGILLLSFIGVQG